MRTLYDGTKVETTIKTDEKVFKILTFDSDWVLCNIKDAQMLLSKGLIKEVYLLWDFVFKRYSKIDLKNIQQ